MSTEKAPPSGKLTVTLAFLAVHGVLVLLPFLARGPEGWIRNAVPDDGFYYLQCAWNLSRGQGLSMDGLHSANGFHPLWMAMLLPFACTAPSKTAFLYAVVGLSAVLFYGAAMLFAHIVRRIFRAAWAADLALVLYIACPFLFLHHVNLLETGLLLTAKLAALLLLLWSIDEKRLTDRAVAGLLGVALAAVFLARTDSVFYLAGLGIAWGAAFLREVLRDGTPVSPGRAVQCPLVLLLAFAAVVSPWFAWNYLNFGEVIQISGRITPYELRTYYGIFHDYDSVNWLDFITGVTYPGFVTRLQLTTTGTGPVFVLVCAGIALLATRRFSPPTRGRVIGVLSLFLFSGAALGIVHTVVRLLPRQWYFLDITLVLLLAFIATAASLFRSRRNTSRAATLASLLAAAVFFAPQWGGAYIDLYQRDWGFYFREGEDMYSRQRLPDDAWYDALQTLWRRHASGGRAGLSVIGHSDGGRAAFFAPQDLRVVNLDGKINNAAAHALLEGRLARYIVESPIEMTLMRRRIADISRFMGPGFRRHFIHIDLGYRDLHGFYVLRDCGQVEERLQLPGEGRIDTWGWQHWHHLLGEWRLDMGEEQRLRYPVGAFGVQFCPLPGTGYQVTLEASLPFDSAPGRFAVLMNDAPLGDIRVMDTAMRIYNIEIPQTALAPGINTLVLAPEAVHSPRMHSLNQDSALATARVRAFRFTPVGPAS